MKPLCMTGYIAFAMTLQLLMGNIPLSFFSFPLNILFAAIWLMVVWVLFKEYKSATFTRFLSSAQTSIYAIGLFIGGAFIIGLFPQLSEAEAAARTGIWAALGCYDFITSWVFTAILLLLLSNLALVTMRVYKYRKQTRWRFLLNHVGLWMALVGGFWGSSDTQTLRIALHKGRPTRKAFDLNGAKHYLAYELELDSFAVEYYSNGTPSRFAANVRIGAEKALLEVNRPYAYGWGEDVYLTGYDVKRGNQNTYCVLQVVKHPWKYITVAGILMMLVGATLLFINGTRSV